MAMARRKTISDDHLLDALLEPLTAVGPADFTYSVASKACGLSPATLLQRYGNRDAFVEAILQRAWDRLDAETEAADAEEAPNPDGAVDLLMRLMPAETAERDTTDGLLLLREDIRNPDLRRRGAAWGRRLAAALGRRLASDPVEGERLGWQMARVWMGAHTWWAFTRDQPAEIAIRRALEDWLGRR